MRYADNDAVAALAAAVASRVKTVGGKADGAATKATSAQRAAGRHPADFGAALDGTTDDTAAIRALHEWCNANNVTPSYKGVRAFAVQANAQIPINTSVDFNGATIRIIGGLVASPSWSNAFNTAFIVRDPDALTTSATVAMPASGFTNGSYEPGAAIGAPEGWLLTQVQNDGTGTAPLISNRERTGGMSWRTCHKVNRAGRTNEPLPVNLSGGATLFYSYRPNSKPIRVGGLSIDLADFNQQTIFRVERNRVTVSDMTLVSQTPQPSDTICKLIDVARCADFTVENIKGLSLLNPNSQGTYVLYLEFVANALIRNCEVRNEYDLGAWPWQAIHYCNGVTFQNCNVDRIDLHAYSLNLTVTGCTLYSSGVSVGQGGGRLQISDCTYLQNRANRNVVNVRSDYGGSWDGDIIVDGVSIVATVFVSAVVDFAATPVGTPGMVSAFARLISVKNVRLIRPNGGTSTNDLIPVRLAVRADGGGVTAPVEIVVSGMECPQNWRMSLSLDLASCLASPMGADVGTRIGISNCAPTSTNAAMPTVSIPVASAAPKTSQRVNIRLSQVENVHIDVPGVDYAGSALRVIGGQVRRVSAPSAMSGTYTGVDFFNPLLAGAEAAAPLAPAGTASGPRFWSIVGGRLNGAFDLSAMYAISGLGSISAQTAGAVLPGSVTREQLFTGWMAS